MFKIQRKNIIHILYTYIPEYIHIPILAFYSPLLYYKHKKYTA